MYNICRLCLKTNLDNHRSLNTDENRLQVSAILPEIDLDVVDTPVLCSDCSDLITTAYTFKQNCLKVEERLESYKNNYEGKIRLEEFLEFEEKGRKLLTVKEEFLDPLEPLNYETPSEELDTDRKTIKIEPKSKVTCKFCSKTYDTPGRRYTDHLRTHLNSNFICIICGVGFDTKTEYFHHRREIHKGNSGINRCPVCNKAFLYKTNFEKHLKSHEKCDKKFQCDSCGLKLKHREKLIEHLRIHTGERPFKCSVCEKAFAQSSTLYTHVKSVHSTERPYICEICGVSFPVKGAYTGHMNRHKNLKKNFVCSVCGNAYRIESQLKEHVRRHTGVREFVCEVCSKGFVNNCGLKKHMRIHNGIKPFECQLCHKRFTQSYNRKIHVKSCMKRKSGENTGLIYRE